MNDTDYAPVFGEPVSDWFRWFAWHPVDTADRGKRWLRPVWRRRIQKHDYLFGGPDFWFQHKVQTLERNTFLLEKAMDSTRQAEAAEAAIERVRALAETWAEIGGRLRFIPGECADDLRAALDQGDGRQT